MKRQILVPLDGSALAETILPHAATLAHLTSSDLTLLRAVPLPAVVEPPITAVAPMYTTRQVWDERLADARDYLADIGRHLQLKGLGVQTEVIDEHPAEAIIAYADQNPNVTVIAMATHGRSGLGRWVFGSVAEKVLHASPKPLLLVRPKPGEYKTEVPADLKSTIYHTIVVPLDGSPFAEQALSWAKSLATEMGATLVLVSGVSEPYSFGVGEEAAGMEWTEEELKWGSDQMASYLKQMADQLRSEGLTVQTQLEHGNPAEAILCVSNQAHADLIVMSSHGRSGLQRMWLGSVAMKVLQGSTLPVLLVRAKSSDQ